MDNNYYIQVLVAEDYRNRGLNVDDVVASLRSIGGDKAVLAVTPTERVETLRSGDRRTVKGARITFDTNHIRNTVAHGIGFRHGFVVHIESER
jgi:hypothetical protein